jgi:signal transduction histidine kinase
MAHGFVRQSGGHIRIASVPGQGTTVSIYLPRAAAQEAAVLPPAPAAH